MKITSQIIHKLLLTEIPSLDPISVYLEDIAPGKGSITISCANESWSYQWNAMGNPNITSFIASCSLDYLADKFAPHLQTQILDFAPIEKQVKANILSSRRHRQLPKHVARTLFDESSDLKGVSNFNEFDRVWKTDFSPDAAKSFEVQLSSLPNPKYQYLLRILSTIQSACQNIPKTHEVCP